MYLYKVYLSPRLLLTRYDRLMSSLILCSPGRVVQAGYILCNTHNVPMMDTNRFSRTTLVQTLGDWRHMSSKNCSSRKDFSCCVFFGKSFHLFSEGYILLQLQSFDILSEALLRVSIRKRYSVDRFLPTSTQCTIGRWEWKGQQVEGSTKQIYNILSQSCQQWKHSTHPSYFILKKLSCWFVANTTLTQISYWKKLSS